MDVLGVEKHTFTLPANGTYSLSLSPSYRPISIYNTMRGLNAVILNGWGDHGKVTNPGFNNFIEIDNSTNILVFTNKTNEALTFEWYYL